jgi:hypothetical protein
LANDRLVAFAPSRSRVDFLMKNESVLFEKKMVREGLSGMTRIFQTG